MTRWTPHEDRELVRLWNEGLSASDIGWRLGRDDKNPVIGRLNRLRAQYGDDLKLIQHGNFTGKRKLSDEHIGHVQRKVMSAKEYAKHYKVNLATIYEYWRKAPVA
jgi:hypothetical protein